MGLWRLWAYAGVELWGYGAMELGYGLWRPWGAVEL
jgi:hypothetical protein